MRGHKEIIVMVVGCCSLHDRQGKRLTTPSHMTETLKELVERSEHQDSRGLVDRDQRTLPRNVRRRGAK